MERSFSYTKSDIKKKAILIENAGLYTEGNHSGDGFMWLLGRLFKVANFKVNFFVEGIIKFNDSIEKEITLNETSLKMENSKPLICKIQDKVYKPKNWYNLIVLIYSDLKNEKPQLYEEIIQDSIVFTKEENSTFYYDEILNMYAKPSTATNKLKEIKFIVEKCNIPLSECILKYEQKMK